MSSFFLHGQIPTSIGLASAKDKKPLLILPMHKTAGSHVNPHETALSNTQSGLKNTPLNLYYELLKNSVR